MSKVNGFLQLRRRLWEHVRDGRMSITGALAFIIEKYLVPELDATEQKLFLNGKKIVYSKPMVAHDVRLQALDIARNEWICWVISAKKPQTRRQHIERVRTELKEGMRRPCCWPGCPQSTLLAVGTKGFSKRLTLPTRRD
jgi:Bacteriocin-protection, YdeI or OmpD-Associated